MIPTDIISNLYVDHVVLTVSNLSKTREFYAKLFGTPEKEDDYSIMYRIDQTKLFLVLPYGMMPSDDRFNPNRIGLEHFAIGVRTLNELKSISAILEKNSVMNSGIHVDKHSGKEKVWLDDPDGIRLEFFIRAG